VPANANLFLRESGGAPFQVNLTGQGTGSSFNFRLETNGSAIFQTDGSSPLAVGAAILTSDVPIGASGIFSVFDAKGRFQTEAGVGAGMAVYGVTLPVDITGKCDTGVAIFNPSGLTVELTLRLLTEDGEAKGGSGKISLAYTSLPVKQGISMGRIQPVVCQNPVALCFCSSSLKFLGTLELLASHGHTIFGICRRFYLARKTLRYSGGIQRFG
jgi:hypothetical protein